MTLVDTSAWVEYLRATGSVTHLLLRDLIDQGAPLHTTDAVVMEVLAGGRDDRHTTLLQRLLGRCQHVPTQGLDDYEQAASLYRRCRRAGETIRSLNDCLIAVVAVRADLPVLHADRDFAAIARHSELQIFKAPRSE